MNDISQKNDALRQVMQRKKSRRKPPVLPEGFEDKVLERIALSSAERPSKQRKTKQVRLWMIHIASAAAIVAVIFFVAETMIPEKEKEKHNAIAKVEISKPLKADTKKEEQSQQKAEAVMPPSHHPAPIPSKQPKRPSIHQESVINTAEKTPFAKVEEDVCIDCEMDAMASELIAMINEFENQ